VLAKRRVVVPVVMLAVLVVLVAPVVCMVE
jgi:hypothetical protein